MYTCNFVPNYCNFVPKVKKVNKFTVKSEMQFFFQKKTVYLQKFFKVTKYENNSSKQKLQPKNLFSYSADNLSFYCHSANIQSCKMAILCGKLVGIRRRLDF